MKKAIHLLLIIGLASVLLAGCSGNLFMQFDQVDVRSVSEIGAVDASSPSASSALIKDVEKWLEADALSDDASTSNAIADKLDEIADPFTLGPDDATKQEAAMLAGSVRIESDENAVELINNLAVTLSTLTDPDSTATAEDVIRNLIPEAVLNDQATFTDMVDTLIAAAASFETFGDTLGTDYSDLSSGEKGDVAQYAAVSILVDFAVTNLPNGIDDLWALSQGSSPTFTNDPIEELDGTSTTTNLSAILTWAGYDSFF
jgi:hypothetical protein